MATVKESTITYIRDDKRVRWYSNYNHEVNKMTKLYEEHPEEVKIILDYRNVTEEDKDLYGFEIECPASWYKMPKPKKQVSDEARERASAMAKARAKNKGSKS